MQSLHRQQDLGLLIAAARRRLKQVSAAHVRRFGLSPAQFWVFLTIAENRGLSLCDLSEGLGIDAPTASRTVAALTAHRLVRIGGRADDRRRHRLTLTPRGAAFARELRPVALELRAAVVRGFSAAEREQLRALLSRVIENLDEFERAAGAL